MTNLPSAAPDVPPTTDLLSYAERNLSQATLRLGRLRTRSRGSQLHRDLTAVFYDIQAAREAIVAVLSALVDPAIDEEAESRGSL